MKEFKEQFFKTATKFAEYVSAKITAAAELKPIPEQAAENKAGGPMYFEDPLEVQKQLCDDMRVLNEVAEMVNRIAADPEEPGEPQKRKVMKYRDGRPYFDEE